MDVILGIDLGTTNSEVAVIIDGRPVVLGDPGDLIVPSVVGLDPQGKLLVGRAARNQFVLSPERTVRSIKRKMGQDVIVRMGEQEYSPQEISAMILRTLKSRAETMLGQAISKAVITVPAFFQDAQREATRVAGELAGLEVVRIINEPTAAVLTYDHQHAERECLLVYDLGGGTFDVSIAQVEAGIVEILASRGDTQLGGDDFDQKLLDYVCDQFQSEHGIDLRESLVGRSRLLNAVEEAKKRLSSEPIVEIIEEFIAERNGVPLNLKVEVTRMKFEELIKPLVAKTLACVADALTDAKLVAPEVAKVLLVGGATRTPIIRHMLSQQLGRPVHSEIEPDLAVAMGAAVQAGLIAGIDVGPVLVDITPHTLGIATLDYDGYESHGNLFSPIIERNSPLPVNRTEVYLTSCDGQKIADIRVYQGEFSDVRNNTLVGKFEISGLSDVPAPNEILVRLDLDLNGILRVTATERMTGVAKQIVVDNMLERFRKRQRVDAQDRIDALFGDIEIADADAITEFHDGLGAEPLDPTDPDTVIADPELRKVLAEARALLRKSEGLEASAGAEDAAELRALSVDLQAAIESRDANAVGRISIELEDIVFYLQDS